MPKDRSLKERLEIILKEYGYEKEPLFRIRFRFILHSALAYEFSTLEGEDFYKTYIGKTVDKANKIFKNIDFKGDLLLVYDNVFNKNSEKEAEFIESSLINIKRKEEYSYNYKSEDGGTSIRRVYQIEDIKTEKLFREISLTDFAGDYDLASSVFIMDLEGQVIFHLYDDRGLYIISRNEERVQKLWESLPDYFFEDCDNFQLGIKSIYWESKSQDIKENSRLCINLDIRIADKIVEDSFVLKPSDLNFLNSLLKDFDQKNIDSKFSKWSIKYDSGIVRICNEEDLSTSCYYLQYKKEILKLLKEVEKYFKK